MSSDVAPVSGQSGGDAAAMLAGSTVAVEVAVPLVVAEQAGSSMVGAAPPAEGPVSPVEVVVTTPSQDQPGAVVVASEGVMRSAPPEA